MIRKTQIQNYKFLIIVLLLVIILQFIFIIVTRLKKRKKRKKINTLNDLSALMIPLSQKIDSLKEDKENYKKNLEEIEEEVKLYSEQILNIVDVGILLVDKKNNIIYKNNWFKKNQIRELETTLETVKETEEKKINDQCFLIKKQSYEELFIYTINNITEIRKLEEEIVLKKKLAYLGEMSAFIAHEFKNSLTAIKGFAAAIKRKSDDAKIVKTVSENIEEEVDYFHKILTDYLNYSKEINLKKQIVNTKSFFTEIISTVFNSNNITFASSIEYIYIDNDKMKQVIINLIKNAIEASENNEIIEVFVENSSNQVNILIKDKGKGIAKENMEKIFNPFFTTKSTGTGLGTSISYQIVMAHGGKLKYLKNENKGTITSITIPF